MIVLIILIVLFAGVWSFIIKNRFVFNTTTRNQEEKKVREVHDEKKKLLGELKASHKYHEELKKKELASGGPPSNTADRRQLSPGEDELQAIYDIDGAIKNH